jgi:hypothetical protein
MFTYLDRRTASGVYSTPVGIRRAYNQGHAVACCPALPEL